MPAVVWSKLLNKPRRVSNEIFHMTDWLPILSRLASGTAGLSSDLDGFDVWPSISEDRPSPRHEVIFQTNPVTGEYAMRHDRYKIVMGLPNDDW